MHAPWLFPEISVYLARLSSFPEIMENAVPLVTEKFRNVGTEFFTKWKAHHFFHLEWNGNFLTISPIFLFPVYYQPKSNCKRCLIFENPVPTLTIQLQTTSSHRCYLIQLQQEDLLDLITALVKFKCILSTTIATQYTFQSSPSWFIE